jgi:hypothetical protein
MERTIPFVTFRARSISRSEPWARGFTFTAAHSNAFRESMLFDSGGEWHSLAPCVRATDWANIAQATRVAASLRHGNGLSAL